MFGVGVGVFRKRGRPGSLASRFHSQEKHQAAIRHYGQALTAIVCRFVVVGSCGAWQRPSTDVNNQHF